MPFTPATLQFIREHQHDDVRTLAFQAGKYPEVDMPAAITQIAGRQAARLKIPSWATEEKVIYPIHLSLEQCSSEVTARYKAGLLKGDTLVDLTGGFGIDCAFLASGFRRVTYIERQETLCDIARHNFKVLGLDHITVQNLDSIGALTKMSPVDCIFIDPARRNEHGGKTILVSDCEPDVEKLEGLLLEKSRRVMIKLSPMLDLSLALRSLPHTSEVHVVSVQNECKELLLLLDAAEENESSSKSSSYPLQRGIGCAKPVPVHCVNFVHGNVQTFVFDQDEESSVDVEYTDKVGDYLYEPNASILKAGAFRSVAARFGLNKLHPNSHLYTSDTYVPDFPGRCFSVTDILSSKDKSRFKQMGKANITVRNYPLSVAELRKRTKLKDGGDIYLFATTLNDDRKVLIACQK